MHVHSFIYDASKPMVTLSTSGIQASPAINTITEMPFLLEGTVHDTALAGFSINNQQVGLLPGADAQ